MSLFSDNHSNTIVPESETVSGFHIAQIYVGVAITLPAFLLSAQIFTSLGFRAGLIALAISAAILVASAALTMMLGARLRWSTYAITSAVFGEGAASLINVLLALTLLGWFAVTVSLFADALNGASSSLGLPTASTWLLKLIGGTVMTMLTLFGFRLINRLASFAVPLLLIVLAISLKQSIAQVGLEAIITAEGTHEPIPTIGAAVSILIGAFMVGVVIAPDLARFVKSQSQGVVASLLSFGCATQVVLVMAGAPALSTGENDFVANLVKIGLGWPSLFVVVFATITTNINNLYSTSLSFGQIVSGAKDYQITAFAGAVGTLVALAGIENQFIPFLVLLSITIPPIAGVYLIDCFLFRKNREALAGSIKWRWIAVCAWLTGSVVAFATSRALISLTTVPALDGLLVAAGIMFLGSSFFRNASPAAIHDNGGG